MEREFISILMVIVMMENGLMIKKMVKVAILILPLMKNMMVGGWMVKSTDLELMSMHLVISIPENGRMEKSMGKGRLNIKMVVNWNANSKKIKLMDWEL